MYRPYSISLHCKYILHTTHQLKKEAEKVERVKMSVTIADLKSYIEQHMPVRSYTELWGVYHPGNVLKMQTLTKRGISPNCFKVQGGVKTILLTS